MEEESPPAVKNDLVSPSDPLLGNRVFCPGQIAWSVLVAIALLWICEVIRKRVQDGSRSTPKQIA